MTHAGSVSQVISQEEVTFQLAWPREFHRRGGIRTGRFDKWTCRRGIPGRGNHLLCSSPVKKRGSHCCLKVRFYSRQNGVTERKRVTGLEALEFNAPSAV